MGNPLLNPRREARGKNAKLTLAEQRFYSAAPRFEEAIRRACGKSIIVLRSDIATGLMRALEELSHEYDVARTESSAAGRPVADLEARYGATLVLVHLQVLTKIDELEELATTGTPVPDVARLADNLSGLVKMLAAIEATASVATTGDLNEEERNKVRLFEPERFVRISEAVQLRREATAAAKRLADGYRDGQTDLIERARARMDEIDVAVQRLRKEGDLAREVELDRVLQQVEATLSVRLQ